MTHSLLTSSLSLYILNWHFIFLTGRGSRKGAAQMCMSCHGTGMQVHVRQLAPGMVQQVSTVCHSCQGQGQRISQKDRCKACGGRKILRQKKILEVHIDKGESEGRPYLNASVIAWRSNKKTNKYCTYITLSPNCYRNERWSEDSFPWGGRSGARTWTRWHHHCPGPARTSTFHQVTCSLLLRVFCYSCSERMIPFYWN